MDFIAYLPRACYVYLPTREPWPAESVNVCVPKVRAGKREMAASTWLSKNRAARQISLGAGAADADSLIACVQDGGWVEKKGVAYSQPVSPTHHRAGRPR